MLNLVSASVWYLDRRRTERLLAEKPRVDPKVQESQLASTTNSRSSKLTASNGAVDRLRSTACSIRCLTNFQPFTCASHDPPLSVPNQRSDGDEHAGHRVLARTGLDRGLVKGASRAQRGQSQAKHAKTLDEPEASQRIVHAMARSESTLPAGGACSSTTCLVLNAAGLDAHTAVTAMSDRLRTDGAEPAPARSGVAPRGELAQRIPVPQTRSGYSGSEGSITI
jgi:hypothetical protein